MTTAKEPERKAVPVGNQSPQREQSAREEPVLDPATDKGRALSLQRQAGNRAVSGLLARTTPPRASAVVVQRHEPGAVTLPKIVRGNPLLSNPSRASTATEEAPSPHENGATTTPTTGGTTGTTTAGTTTTTPTVTTPTVTTPTTGTTPTVPVPVLQGTLDVAFAQNAIHTVLGGVAGRPIIQGNIHVVNGHAEVCAAYDRWMIAHHMTNPRTGAPWALGDKLATNTANNSKTNAFAYPPPATDIYVDSTTTDPTATVHEMLHINTATDFFSKTGRVINEGVTQRLANKVVLGSGHPVTGSERTYQQEQDIVTRLVNVVGEDTVTNAYFHGAGTLLAANETALGTGVFAVIKQFLDNNNYASARPLIVARPTPTPTPTPTTPIDSTPTTGTTPTSGTTSTASTPIPPRGATTPTTSAPLTGAALAAANKKVSDIRGKLRGVVTRKDLDQVGVIYRGASAAESQLIRSAVTEMMRHGVWRSQTKDALRQLMGISG